MRGGEDELGPLAVVERVVDQAGVEAAAEVELLVVARLEDDVEPFARGLLAGDRDHLRRDVVALGVDAVSRGEAGHPAGAAAELDEARADVQVEQLQDVAEVDQEACGLARVVPERLGSDPVAALVADAGRVVDLGLLARVVGGHAPMIGVQRSLAADDHGAELRRPASAPCRSPLCAGRRAARRS